MHPAATLVATVLLAFVLVPGVAVSTPPALERALDAQRELAAARPGDPQALNDLGNLLALADEPEAAIEAYRAALAADPSLTSAHFNLAVLLQERGAHGEAVEELELLVEQEPNHAWAHYQIGVSREARGKSRGAIRAYATAFAIDPSLSFPEVNPQVVDNALVTEALLRVPVRAGSEAPRRYEDPGRIARLLLPSPPEEESDEPADNGEGGAQPLPTAPLESAPTPSLDPDAETGTGLGRSEGESAPQARPDDDSGEVRIIDSRSLRSGGGGRTSVGGGARSQDTRATGPGRGAKGRPGADVSEPSGGNRPTGVGGDPYRPSSRSTGQTGSRIDGN